jgi:transposase
VLDLDGGVIGERTVATKEAALRLLFEGKGRMRIALEAGTHSPWISRLLVALRPRDVGRQSAEVAADCGERCEA